METWVSIFTKTFFKIIFEILSSKNEINAYKFLSKTKYWADIFAKQKKKKFKEISQNDIWFSCTSNFCRKRRLVVLHMKTMTKTTQTLCKKTHINNLTLCINENQVMIVLNYELLRIIAIDDQIIILKLNYLQFVIVYKLFQLY